MRNQKSVGELEWIPVNAPNPNLPNFFRTSSVELMFESPLELENAWSSISEEVLSNVNALAR